MYTCANRRNSVRKYIGRGSSSQIIKSVNTIEELLTGFHPSPLQSSCMLYGDTGIEFVGVSQNKPIEFQQIFKIVLPQVYLVPIRFRGVSGNVLTAVFL